MGLLDTLLPNDHELEGILDTYSFEEILELNDLSLQDALGYLVHHNYIDLPEIRPLEF